MKYRTRLIVFYAAIAFILSICMGTISSMQGFQYENETEKNALSVTNTQLITQMEDRLDRMDSIMNYILSDPDMLSDIQVLGLKGEVNVPTAEILRMENELQNGISTVFIYKNSYRTVFCNRDGVLIGTYDRDATMLGSNTRERVESVSYLKDAETLLGKPLLIGPHNDPWASRNNQLVYSLVKAVQGYNMGYLETENLCKSLETLEVPSDTIRFRILLKDGTVLYDSDGSLYESDELHEQFKKLSGGEPVRWKNLVLCAGESELYDFRVETAAALDSASRNKLIMSSVLISAMLFAFGLVLILLWSNRLMQPISKLREVMENTTLANLKDSLPKNSLSMENDELQALERSYRAMTKRLDQAVQSEQRSSVLQLQAQLDTLQAQVNPHFIYNVLNIISARGIMDDDENICEMCGALASMLQYSTSNKERYASVAMELRYLENYFYLMKSRYEEKFETHIDIPDSIRERTIPKMVLQQIVENCVAHAFEQTKGLMEIRLLGEENDTYWRISVCDNGSGFAPEKLEDVRSRIEAMKESIDSRDSSIELEIGGMGLISTFARCYLLLGKNLIFRVENEESGSARVTIGEWK